MFFLTVFVKKVRCDAFKHKMNQEIIVTDDFTLGRFGMLIGTRDISCNLNALLNYR